MSNKVLNDIVKRTNGEIYIGVVGPVRSGKSTFIRKFMEIKVLPYINDKQIHDKILDELPQSGEGKLITTVEPKFIPSTQIKVVIDNDMNISVRLVDCVGYIIPSAKGYMNDDGTSRLVQTPWFGESIPFEDAATLGTKKVIDAHSHIGIVVTSDGSFGDFSRPEYEKVEEEIISELKNIKKPFVIILNTSKPNAIETTNLVKNLEDKYEIKVIAIDVKNQNENDIDAILKKALEEFDITELNLVVPNWIKHLNDNIEYKEKFNELVNLTTGQFRKMKDIFNIQEVLMESGLFLEVNIDNVDTGSGIVDIGIECDENLYLNIVEEIIGEKLNDKGKFIEVIQDFVKAKEVYKRIGNSLETLDKKGYSLIIPEASQMELLTPELIKDGNRYGIKLKANATVIELVQLKIDSSFEPIIGSKEQAEALMTHMLKNYEEDPNTLWKSEIFGRELGDVINDGVKGKINNINDEIQNKFKESLEKVINNNKGGIIAIIL